MSPISWRAAKGYIVEGKTVCHAAGDKYLEAKATRHLAVIERDTGESALADQHFREAMHLAGDIVTERDREEMVTNILDMIGVMQLEQGRLEEAKKSFYSASEGFHRLND
jgi:Flp pilus assembly protein TadD